MSSRDVQAVIELAPFFKLTARGTGRRIVGSKGSGKTRLLAMLCLVDLLTRVPTVVIDPTGALSSWLFSDLERETEAVKGKVRPRLRYYKIAGMEDEKAEGEDEARLYIPTFPLLYQRPGEYLQDIVQRPLETWLRLDPNLATASVQGANALQTVGSLTGMLLYSMTPKRQLIEAYELLRNPTSYRQQIEQAVAENPDELSLPAAYFLDEYPKMNPRDRDNQTSAFRNKLRPLILNPRLRAIYGADSPSITLEEIVAKRLFVILDFSQIFDAQQKNFAVLWLYNYFLTAFRVRPPGKDQLPIAFYIDEASFILPPRGVHNPLLEDDFLQFMQQSARQNNIYVTLVHQELRQFNDAINDMLVHLGAQVFGTTIDAVGSKEMAQRFIRYNPYQVKITRPVHAVIEQVPTVIDQQEQYFTYDEQLLAYADRFRDLQTFQFLYGVGAREGSLPRYLSFISLEEYTKGRYPMSSAAQATELALMKRYGRNLKDVLEEIDSRNNLPPPNQPQQTPPFLPPDQTRGKKLTDEEWDEDL